MKLNSQGDYGNLNYDMDASLVTHPALDLSGSVSPSPSDSIKLSEQDIVDAVRAGDIEAMALIYDQHHEVVRAFANRLVNDNLLAEDLVHEVFVSLPRALRRFRGDAKLRTFILGIAANQARHAVRSAARRRRAYERYSKRGNEVQDDPETIAHRKELAEALKRAMDTLPYKQRVAFVLCDVEERTSAEAAKIVGVPAPTMRTRLFHARKKLRARLEEEKIR